MRIRITLAALIAACGIMVIPPPGEAQQMAIGPSTAAQAQAGRAAYQGNCGACHAPDLSGREGPQLAGANFMSEWGARTAGELIGFMRATMPPGAGGSLPDQTYVNLAAFILDANSARPGERTLTADSAVTIGSVASGRRAAYFRTIAATDQAPSLGVEKPSKISIPLATTVMWCGTGLSDRDHSEKTRYST